MRACERGGIVQALARHNGPHGLLNCPERVLSAWRRRWQQKTADEIPDIMASCNRHRVNACAR